MARGAGLKLSLPHHTGSAKMSTIQSSVAMKPGLSIPVLDLGPALSGDPSALAATATALREACETIGFFFVRNHGVDQPIIDRAFVECERFHASPLDEKMKVRVMGKVVGYLPLGGQTQKTSVHGKSIMPDRSASFYIRQEFAADHPDRLAGKPWIFDNRWPENLPGFREGALAYFDAMAGLGHSLLELHALALGLPRHHLTSHEAFLPPTYNLRMLHYPTRDPELAGQFGIGPHTDYSYCTILAQSNLPGLEILTRDGEWIEAPALDGHLLINNGDMCRRWTNERFRSAPHRVINRTGQTRYSVPFFIGPRLDVTLDCWDTCEGPDGQRPEPLSFGEYMANINKKNYDLGPEAAK
jgi:isopenicillin N synthase-like dioxygenase